MKVEIDTSRDVWRITTAITAVAIIVTELGYGMLYLVAGETGFTAQNVMLVAAVLCLIIAPPATYYMAHISLALSRTKRELHALANTDPLTHLPNRRAFFETALDMLHDKAPTATLLVFDADYFKDLNDTYGHLVGDKALVAIAGILRTSFRENDLVSRIGGEEFAVLIPDMAVAQAEKLASRVVSKVAASPLLEPGAIVEYSVSCGIADTTQAHELHDLFKAADDAMYMAKRQGRNRVVRLQQTALPA